MKFNIGAEIKKVVDQRGMIAAEFARRINTSSQNANDIFTRKSIDTELLAKISTVLEYDFFELYFPKRKLVPIDSDHKIDKAFFDDTVKMLRGLIDAAREDGEKWRQAYFDLSKRFPS